MSTSHVRHADRLEALEHDYLDGEKSLAEVIEEAFDMGVRGATEAIPRPVGVDPDWKQKIELAKQARERPPAPPSPKPLAIKEGGKRRP